MRREFTSLVEGWVNLHTYEKSLEKKFKDKKCNNDQFPLGLGYHMSQLS